MQSASRNEKGTTMTLTEIFQGALLCCDQNRGNYICFLLLSDIFHSISSTHSLIIIDEYLVVKSRNVNIGLMEIRGRERGGDMFKDKFQNYKSINFIRWLWNWMLDGLDDVNLRLHTSFEASLWISIDECGIRMKNTCGYSQLINHGFAAPRKLFVKKSTLACAFERIYVFELIENELSIVFVVFKWGFSKRSSSDIFLDRNEMKIN